MEKDKISHDILEAIKANLPGISADAVTEALNERKKLKEEVEKLQKRVIHLEKEVNHIEKVKDEYFKKTIELEGIISKEEDLEKRERNLYMRIADKDIEIVKAKYETFKEAMTMVFKPSSIRKNIHRSTSSFREWDHNLGKNVPTGDTNSSSEEELIEE